MPNFVVLYYEPVNQTRQFVAGPEADKTFLANDANQACELAGQQEKKSGKFSAALLSDIQSSDVIYAPAASGTPTTW